MFSSFYLLTLVLSSFSTAQVAPATCSLASFDRCGPANQRPGTPNTCNATVPNSGRNVVYGARCFQAPELQSRLVPDNCVNAALPDICNKLTDPHVLRDQWIWTNPAIIGCAFGFWLPAGNGTDAAFAPDYNRCTDGIFGPLAKYCTNPSWNNAGSVNIQIMPNASTSGQAIDPGYPSYVIAPAALTTTSSSSLFDYNPSGGANVRLGTARRRWLKLY